MTQASSSSNAPEYVRNNQLKAWVDRVAALTRAESEIRMP